MTHPPDVHDMVRELTTEHTHREPYTAVIGQTTWQTHHHTQVPALVYQLVGATPAASGAVSTAESGSVPTSRPAARIEALDTVMLIDDEAGWWIDRLGGIIPADRIDPETHQAIPGTGTVARLRRLHGLHPQAQHCGKHHGRKDDNGTWCCERHDLEHAIWRWWHQARIITGWDSPAYRPFNTCPVCDHRGGLRINLELQSGLCVECRSIWDPSQIGLLAEHIREENTEGHTEVASA